MQNPFADLVPQNQQRPLPQVIEGPPREAPPQTVAQATKDEAEAAAAPYTVPRAQADLTNTGLTIEERRRKLANEPIEGIEKRAAELRGEFDRRAPVLLYRKSLPIYGDTLSTIAKSRTDASSAEDLKLVYNYAKIMDPESVVRESETESVQGLATKGQQLYTQMMRQVDPETGMLPAAVREQLAVSLVERLKAYNTGYLQERQTYEELARKSRIPDIGMVVLPHEGAAYLKYHDALRGTTAKRPLDPTGEGDIGFNQPVDHLPPGAIEFQRELEDRVNKGLVKTPGEARAFALGRGRALGNEAGFNLEQDDAVLQKIINDVFKGVPASVATPQYKVDITDRRDGSVGGESVDAFGRGAADTATLGAANYIAAAGDTIFGDGTMRENLAEQRAVDRFDEKEHLPSRIAGQVVGGFALPTGVAGAARTGATQAMRGGASRAEAIAAGRVAGAQRLGGEAAGYGGTYGFVSTEGGLGERAQGAAVNALGSGVAALGLGHAVNALALRGGGANAAREAGERLNIPPTPSTTGGPVTGAIQLGLGNLPGASGPVAAGAMTEVNALAASARGVADRLGPVLSREQAGNRVTRGAQAFDRASSRQGTRLYNQRDALMGGPDTLVTLPGAQGAVRSFMQQYPTSEVLRDILVHPAVRRLQEPTENGVVTLREATDALSHVRTALRNASKRNVTTNAEERQISMIEDAIEGDVMAAARQADAQAGRTGNNTAEAAQRRADAYWRGKKRTTDGAMKTPLRAGRDDLGVSGTAVFRELAKDMEREGGNLRRLRQTWQNLPQGARRSFSGTLFDDLGRATDSQQDAAGEAWSFQTFMTRWSKLDRDAKALVFGGRGADREIQDIATYASRLRDTDKFRNFSNTARNTIAGAFLATVGGALLRGNLPEAGIVAAGIPAANASARVFMATPAMRRWTTGTLRAMAGGNERALRARANELTAIAARNTAMSQDILSLRDQLLEADPKPK